MTDAYTQHSNDNSSVIPDYVFRKLVMPQDESLLIKIHKTYDTEYGFERGDGDYSILTEYLRRHGDTYHPLALIMGGEVAGYMRAYDRLSTSSCDIVMMLDLVYVMPDFRGRGCGKILMAELLKYAYREKKARIDLLTDHDNPAAKNLYAKFGFKGRDRHQMILFLKDQPSLVEYFEHRLKKS